MSSRLQYEKKTKKLEHVNSQIASARTSSKMHHAPQEKDSQLEVWPCLHFERPLFCKLQNRKKQKNTNKKMKQKQLIPRYCFNYRRIDIISFINWQCRRSSKLKFFHICIYSKTKCHFYNTGRGILRRCNTLANAGTFPRKRYLRIPVAERSQFCTII